MQPVRLFCFPFAAGSCYSYQQFQRTAQSAVRWIPLDYPGRGRRLFEPPLTTLNDLVDDLYEHLQPQLDGEFAFFGHSMGSLVAFSLTKRLRAAGLTMPTHLFLSGRGGATIPEKHRDAINLTREEIIDEVVSLGGNLSDLLKHPRLFDQYERILRSDMLALESYAYEGPAALSIPATVLIGSQDVHTPHQAHLWQAEFTNTIGLEVLPGGHFFLFDHVTRLVELVEERLCRPADPGDIAYNFSN